MGRWSEARDPVRAVGGIAGTGGTEGGGAGIEGTMSHSGYGPVRSARSNGKAVVPGERSASGVRPEPRFLRKGAMSDHTCRTGGSLPREGRGPQREDPKLVRIEGQHALPSGCEEGQRRPGGPMERADRGHVHARWRTNVGRWRRRGGSGVAGGRSLCLRSRRSGASPGAMGRESAGRRLIQDCPTGPDGAAPDQPFGPVPPLVVTAGPTLTLGSATLHRVRTRCRPAEQSGSPRPRRGFRVAVRQPTSPGS